MNEPWSPEAFEARFTDRADPWRFRTAPYEQRRYQTIEAALGGGRFLRAYEPGCAVGELTWRLARHAERVEACDVSVRALRRARRRCAGLGGVTLRRRDVREGPPAGEYDLVVLSEVGYYLSPPELRRALDRTLAQTVPGALLVCAHWMGESADHRLHADEVHRVVRGHRRLTEGTSARHRGFRLDVWRTR